MAQISSEEILRRGIMVDVEAGGPSPSRYPLLSIGAVLMSDHSATFYAALKPDIWNFQPAAMAVHKLDPWKLWRDGKWARDALMEFASWARTLKENPLFIAHNAAFDWMFLVAYFDKYDIPHPFGHWPFDTKTAYGNILMDADIPHHALGDACLQREHLLRHYERAA